MIVPANVLKSGILKIIILIINMTDIGQCAVNRIHATCNSFFLSFLLVEIDF